MSCIATVGIVTLAGVDLQTNQQINSIIPKTRNHRFYNYYVIKEKTNYIKMLASSGSATPNLNRGQFARISTILPPDEVLKKFDEAIESVIDQVLENSVQIQSLTALRDTLLPKLISGKVKV